MHAHQEHLFILAHFALRSSEVDKQRNQMFFPWMHLVRVLYLLPISDPLKQLVLTFVVYRQICQALIEYFTHFH